MRQRICSLSLGALMVLFGWRAAPAEIQAPAPDFKEVYALIRTNVEGLSSAELNRAAVEALLTALGPKVALVGEPSASGSTARLVSKRSSFDGDIAYLRIGAVGEGLAKAVATQCRQAVSTNKLIGVVLDLRYANGYDYAAAAAVADLFLSKEQPLLDWGRGVVSSKAKTDAIAAPVAVLVNAQTVGAAEALAAVMRETGTALVLGHSTAGQAMMGREVALSNGSRLRIATGPIHLADGSSISEEGVKPDISVEVTPEAERAYFLDAFQDMARTNTLANSSLTPTNQLSGTNRTRRIRFNEAELVRERREGIDPEAELSTAGTDDSEKPTVRDPVLARALDVLKGLAVVRQSHS